jgi:hypothetical protein
MMYRTRILTGILLAVVLAGGLGLAVGQIFPSGPGVSTSVSTATATSTQVSESTVTSVSTIVTTFASSTATSTAATTTTGTSTAISTATSTSVGTVTSISSATSVTTTTAISTTTVSSTSTCAAPAYCGELLAGAPALTAANSSSAYATLTFTLVNAGNLNLTEIEVSVNGSLLATVTGPAAAQTVTYLLQIAPDTIMVSPGQNYLVQVTSSTVYGAGPAVSFSATAAQ